MESIFKDIHGSVFQFGDHVYAEMVLAPDDERSGILVQIRKGGGQFGSNMYLIRRRDGGLARFENVLLRHVSDKSFDESFYIRNGKEPPVIEPQEILECDTVETVYTISEGFPETGFIIENPINERTPGAFTMTVAKSKRDS